MTDFTRYRSRTRDIQDGSERGIWGKRKEVDGAGAVMSVRGTATLDLDLPIMNFGYSFNVPEDYNTEVIMMSLGSDTNLKVAIPTIPRDKQHSWPEGTGGVQHPTDPERRIEFNGDETWLKDGVYKLGNNKELTVKIENGVITISASGDMVLEADTVDIKSSELTHNGTNVGDTHVHGGIRVGPSDTQGPH